MKTASCAILLVLCFAHLSREASGDMHIRIKNELSKDMKIKLHCRDGNHSLGTQVIVRGMAIEWHVNTSQTSAYYCDVEWNELEGFHFEAYSHKDNHRCGEVCSWHITEGGPLLLNHRTGSWEHMPFNPSSEEKKRVASVDLGHHHCFCWPPKHE